MKIGIDFDNTIVSYDKLFYQIAVEKKIITSNFPVNKIAVRNRLRSLNQEDIWTVMQGEVYGLRLREATPYPYFFDFIKAVQRLSHQIFIISHKTKVPFAGPAYDLHQAAREWIIKNMELNGIKFDESKSAFFEITQEKKIERIARLDCDVFIDDLPEILSMPGFPSKTVKILFDPDNTHTKKNQKIINLTSWKRIEKYLNK
jgi:hypothetical protein